ncbi:hypothetical protein SEA_TECHAGE_59 [Mycobacterium phage Techage]|uniref:Uncharacterized protein n=1 Tax=Mycobacterium phage Techage TaxID=2591077 RepID=A0A514A5V3_9CAUD|nr:hypothetical protein SEA_TECHAGE_59 [Mycobacterium phage Techage]
MTDSLGAPDRIVAQVGLPQPQHLPAARADIGVLGAVERDAAQNARLGRRTRSVVPVVAVELENQSCGGNNGVGRELAAEHDLTPVAHAEAVEKRVTGALGARRATGLLGGVHAQQQFSTLGICVAASQGTVGYSVRARLGARRRPAELVAAHLAYMHSFRSTLVRVVAVERTELPLALGYSAARNVERRPTMRTRPRFAGTTFCTRGGQIAVVRAEPLTGPHPARDRVAAPRARNRAHLIARQSFSHKCKSTATVNPIEVMR